MGYTRVIFEDDVTPLDATVMNTLDKGIKNNESGVIEAKDAVNNHLGTGRVHFYDNISSEVGRNASYFSSPSSLREEALVLHKQLEEIIGSVWNASSWYGTNLSSHTNDIQNLSERANISNVNDINNLSIQTNISLPNRISANDTDINNLSSDVYSRIFSISWNGSVSENQYLIGGDRVDTLYQFNTSITLVDSRFTMKFYNSSGNLQLTYNDSSGEVTNWSSGFTNNSYYRDSISLLDTQINPDDGVSVQATNVSQLESLFMTINYKE